MMECSQETPASGDPAAHAEQVYLPRHDQGWRRAVRNFTPA